MLAALTMKTGDQLISCSSSYLIFPFKQPDTHNIFSYTHKVFPHTHTVKYFPFKVRTCTEVEVAAAYIDNSLPVGGKSETNRFL